MAIRYEKIQPGMTLYDRHRYKMGNTTMSTLGEWKVKILELVPDKRAAKVSWNGNPSTVWYEHSLKKLYDWGMNDEGVEVKRGMMGSIISVKRVKKVKVG